jgi:hypothetical protein
MNLKKLTLPLILGLSLLFGACQESTQSEDAGEAVENAGDDAGDAIEDAGDDAKDAVEDTKDAVEDTTN